MSELVGATSTDSSGSIPIHPTAPVETNPIKLIDNEMPHLNKYEDVNRTGIINKLTQDLININQNVNETAATLFDEATSSAISPEKRLVIFQIIKNLIPNLTEPAAKDKIQKYIEEQIGIDPSLPNADVFKITWEIEKLKDSKLENIQTKTNSVLLNTYIALTHNFGGRDWLSSKEGEKWMSSEDANSWLGSAAGNFYLSRVDDGRRWLISPAGQNWLERPEGHTFLARPEGSSWLLGTEQGKTWLNSENGKGWLKSSDGYDWLDTQKGQNWLQHTKEGQAWQGTEDGLDWKKFQDNSINWRRQDD